MSKITPYVALIFVVMIVCVSCTSSGDQTADTESAKSTELASNHGQAGISDDQSKKNILQIAIGSPDHTTLVAAVQAAELENVLVNAGPLTVFAPNNAAFDKLPAGTVDTLLKPENKDKLTTILTSHAAPGTFAGDLLKDGDTIYMATGHYVNVEVKDGDTYIGGAKILGTVDATNGVVHVLDTVLLLE